MKTKRNYFATNYLNSVTDNFEVLIFDLYGTLWNGNDFYPGVLDELKRLRSEGKFIIILSNWAALSNYVEKVYYSLGMLKGVHYDRMVTSGEFFSIYYSNVDIQHTFAAIGHLDLQIFAKSGWKKVESLEEADIVYLGNPQVLENGTWHDLLDISAFIPQLEQANDLGKVAFCVNPDRKSHSSEYKEMVMRPGAFADYYEKIGGRVNWLGKPCREIFEYALNEIDISRDKVLMVGDALETDILGGLNAGIQTVLLKTGVSYHDMMNAEREYRTMKEYCAWRGIIPGYIFENIC